MRNEINRPILIVKRAKELKKANNELSQQQATSIAIGQLTNEGVIRQLPTTNEQN
jgi:hypothetical protein